MCVCGGGGGGRGVSKRPADVWCLRYILCRGIWWPSGREWDCLKVVGLSLRPASVLLYWMFLLVYHYWISLVLLCVALPMGLGIY